MGSRGTECIVIFSLTFLKSMLLPRGVGVGYPPLGTLPRLELRQEGSGVGWGGVGNGYTACPNLNHHAYSKLGCVIRREFILN